MKVLMFGWEFPPYNSGGLGTACYGLTKGLSKQDLELTFVLPRRIPVNVDFLKMAFGDDEFENSTKCIKKGYFVNSLLSAYITSDEYNSKVISEEEKKSKFKRDFYGSNLFEEVSRYGSVGGEIAKKEDFDIIHAHDWLTYPAAIEAKNVSKKPLVVHVHATEFDRTGGNGNNEQVYKIEKMGMEISDMIIAVSNFTKSKIMEHYGIKSEKIKVVHNSVEIEDYTLQKAHDLKRHNKIVLFLGRITLQKGPDYFIRAAKRVLEKNKNVIFVVAGSGDMEKHMIEQAANSGIADKVLFAGFLRGNDLNMAYRIADLYVMPSVSEPFGITPLESIMNSTPVLISKQSGVSEVLNHCLKSDFWDVDDMANKISGVLNYPELHSCLRENGIREVKTWSWDSAAEQCFGVYKEVLAR